MGTVLAVAAGGAVGAVLRLQLTRLNGPGWPRGTLLANLAGTVLLAALVAVGASDVVMALLGGGLAGGMTTFSTLVNEVTPAPRQRAGYLATTVAVGVLIAAFGAALS